MADNIDNLMYTSFGSAGPDVNIASRCLEVMEPIVHTSARDRYSRIEPGISVREGSDRTNYEFFRPGEAIPTKQDQIINVCDDAYRKIGFLHHVIDMMTDFVCQGIEIYHPSKSKQRRYRHWFKKVGGAERSERFINYLFRHGVVFVKRSFSDLSLGDVKDLDTGQEPEYAIGKSSPADIKYERTKNVKRNRIPMKYSFLNPSLVQPIGGELAMFAGVPLYGMKVPSTVSNLVKNPKTQDEKDIVAKMPSDIVNSIRSGKRLLQLDPEKVSAHFYKKDDWNPWSDPLAYSILSDLNLYQKMKHADAAALDGSISRIRIWKLGLPEHKIMPGPGAFKKLHDQLLAASAGDTIDLIWDAGLNLQESSTDVYRFLGQEKYEPVLQSLYAGLGIPQSLTGGSGGSGMTNNAMSLKTMLKRLQYARDLIIAFWEEEFRYLQKAFGDRYPAQIKFEHISLMDEAAELRLWIDLVDRDLISMEAVQEKFDRLPEVERQRIRDEYKMREEGKVPDKASPYHEAQPELQLRKIALQQGTISPVESGVKKKPKGKDKSALDHQNDMQQQQIDLDKQKMDHDMKMREKELKVQEKQGQDLHEQKLKMNEDVHKQKLKQQDIEHKAMLPIKTQMMKKKASQVGNPKTKGTPGQGRPPGSGDTNKRKQRVDKPRTSASVLSNQIWARRTQQSIADTVNQLYLNRENKKNLRSLSTAAAADLENVKFAILCSIEPGQQVNKDVIAELFESSPVVPDEVMTHYTSLLQANYQEVEPTVDEIRELQIAAYAEYLGEINNG